MARSVFHRLAGSLRSRKSPRLYQVALAVLVLLLLVQLARFLWVLVTPYGPVGDWQMQTAQRMAPAARLALFSSFDPHFRGQPVSAGAAETITSLQLTLYGTRMNVASGGGSAIIANTDGVQEIYWVGDEVTDGVTLAGVQFDHVVLERGGAQELLYMDQSIPAETVGQSASTGSNGPGMQAVAAAAAQKVQPTQAPSAAAIKNGIGFAPRNVNGKVTGIVLAPRGNGDIFRAAGFREGDIITGFNGRQIRSTADIEALSKALAPGERMNVQVERGADTVPIIVNLDSQ